MPMAAACSRFVAISSNFSNLQQWAVLSSECSALHSSTFARAKKKASGTLGVGLWTRGSETVPALVLQARLLHLAPSFAAPFLRLSPGRSLLSKQVCALKYDMLSTQDSSPEFFSFSC